MDAPAPSQGLLPSHHRASSSISQGNFDNPWSTWKDRGFKELWKWQHERAAKKLPAQGMLSYNPKPSLQQIRDAFPVAPVDWEAVVNPAGDCIQVTWVGHATLLVQMGGISFLTDPMFSTRASAVQFAGPARNIPPAFNLDVPQLPNISFVVLSHNHYDHLDAHSVKAIYKRFGDKVKWYVPLGLDGWFRRVGVHNVVGMDWWDTQQHHDNQTTLDVTFVPAQHWSMRTGLDRKKSLWGGFLVTHNNKKFWFAGDTGYCSVFKEIGRRFGPIDVSAIPIGAYEPRWFMAPQHIDPQQAVQIHQEVGSCVSLAIHWGTFNLTDEPLDEPPLLLKQEVAKAGLPASSFIALQHGGTLTAATAGKILNTPQLWQPPVPPS